jgi:hypothetical protein
VNRAMNATSIIVAIHIWFSAGVTGGLRRARDSRT